MLVCHHGAGASGLSFAALAKDLRDKDAELGVLAFDARGHGQCILCSMSMRECGADR